MKINYGYEVPKYLWQFGLSLVPNTAYSGSKYKSTLTISLLVFYVVIEFRKK